MSWNREKLLAIRRNLHAAAASLTDEAALETPELFPLWQAGTAYPKDSRVRAGGVLYRCVQAHTAQEGWTPGTTPAL